jgi:hypothetical protein
MTRAIDFECPNLKTEQPRLQAPAAASLGCVIIQWCGVRSDSSPCPPHAVVFAPFGSPAAGARPDRWRTPLVG